jgi:RNA polymerase sigma-70 factor (ECF subfamily)
LVSRHQSAVRHFLRHLCGDPALADDLAQDAFVEAHRSLRSFRRDSPFLTWLLGIAHNRYRNARRLKREVLFAPAELPESEPTAPKQRESELRADLAMALSRLDPSEQTALHLFYQQGLAHPEIASVTGWPLGTVKTHLARAKDKLRPLLQAWNPKS